MSPHTLRLPQKPVHELSRGFAIETKYIGPTDHKGSRIGAVCRRDNQTVFRAVIGYDYSMECLELHQEAALAVLRKIEAHNDSFSFTLQAVAPTERGYIFITQAHGIR